ncbi:hypothetical protein F5B21DRAFT_10367 [Xylaria acuta]|nr:hypothetical protein F5B21DRAFT_10367 [Xylaria acuta]
MTSSWRFGVFQASRGKNAVDPSCGSLLLGMVLSLLQTGGRAKVRVFLILAHLTTRNIWVVVVWGSSWAGSNIWAARANDAAKPPNHENTLQSGSNWLDCRSVSAIRLHVAQQPARNGMCWLVRTGRLYNVKKFRVQRSPVVEYGGFILLSLLWAAVRGEGGRRAGEER